MRSELLLLGPVGGVEERRALGAGVRSTLP